jgi:hypothetical protein
LCQRGDVDGGLLLGAGLTVLFVAELGARTPVLVFPKELIAAPAPPLLPRLAASPAFGPGEPPVPFSVLPLESVLPVVDPVPVDVPDLPPDEPTAPPPVPALLAAPPPAAPPLPPAPPPPLCASANVEPRANAEANAKVVSFIASSLKRKHNLTTTGSVPMSQRGSAPVSMNGY